MRNRNHLFSIALSLCSAFLLSISAKAGGVTVITHGLNGNADGWVKSMATAIPKYYKFPGSNYTFYNVSFYYNNGYYLQWKRLGGVVPSTSESCEIILAFDWSQLDDGN